jgi:hypothetical protein
MPKILKLENESHGTPGIYYDPRVWFFASEDAGCAINVIDRDSNGRVDDDMHHEDMNSSIREVKTML